MAEPFAGVELQRNENGDIQPIQRLIKETNEEED